MGASIPKMIPIVKESQTVGKRAEDKPEDDDKRSSGTATDVIATYLPILINLMD